jgi:multiple sugar transport system substrate-binding protein|nr:extracellular solute-binding protein [uncultured Acetatifactor sp.]
MKRKFLAVLLTAVMTAGVAGCGNPGSGESSSAQDSSSGGQKEEQSSEQNQEQSAENSDAQDESADGDQVTLRFASWALGTAEENNIERQMIAAFEDSHPNIKIEIAEEITGSWNEALATAAAGNSLPDVSLIATLPTAVSSGWALNLNDLIAADSDWNMIPESLRESGAYNGKSYGIPTSMHLAGMFINTELFDEMNVTPLTYGYSWDDFMAAVEKLHNPSQGIAALKYVNDFPNFLPYIWDENQGWYTYDGTQVHLDSPEFIRAVKETQNLAKYSWAGLSDDQKNITAGAEAGDYDAWLKGYTAIWYDASYCCGGYTDGTGITYNVEYVGLPDGKNAIIPDYCFISATTEHPQEAWEFVKFMFWGVDAAVNRMDIDAADDSVSWVALPITADEEVLKRYFEAFPVKGVQEAYENMDANGTVVEAFKFAPAYEFVRWNGTTGIELDGEEATMGKILDKCILGELSIDDYASQLNTLANNLITTERAAIDAATK